MDFESPLLSSMAFESGILFEEPFLDTRTYLSSLNDMDSPVSSDAGNSPLEASAFDCGSAESDDEPLCKKRMRGENGEPIRTAPAPEPKPVVAEKRTGQRGNNLVPTARVAQFLQSLSTEEKTLLEADGVVLPAGGGPITKAEERELKRMRRKIKNKISAQDSRRRRKEYMSQLEQENEELKSQVKQLQTENKTLTRHVSACGEAMGRRAGAPGTQRACMVMMMLLALSTQATVPCAATSDVGASLHNGASASNSTMMPLLPTGRSDCTVLDSSQTALVTEMLSSAGLVNKAAVNTAALDCVFVRAPLAADQPAVVIKTEDMSSDGGSSSLRAVPRAISQ